MSPRIDSASLLPLVASATRAASSHNSQPWRFQVLDDRVRILPDFSRRCPVVDPDDHHLYASLGCAAENLVVAARAQGLEATVDVLGQPGAGHVVEVALRPGRHEASPLAEALAHRQCTRAPFDGRAVPADHLRALEQAATGDGVSAFVLTDPTRIRAVADWVARGNTAQFADRRWRDELIEWLRFDERHARDAGDGLWNRVTGNPEVPRRVGRLVVRWALSARAQNRKDVPAIHSSAGIVVFVSDADDPAHWVAAGRRYERFALQATAFGIRNALVNQPIEIPSLRAQFATWLGVGARRPDLIARFGYGPEMPRSLRRPVADVVVPPDA